MDEETENEQKDNGKKKDSIKLMIYKGEELIRTLKVKTPEKAGLHRVYWELDERGADTPSREPIKNKAEPAGMRVKPGSYRIQINYGVAIDETSIQVDPDPRLQIDSAALEAVYDAEVELRHYTQLTSEAVKQLTESRKTAIKLRKQMRSIDKEKFQEDLKSSNKMVKRIDDLIALYLGKDDKRQGLIRNKEMTVVKRIQRARSYVRTRQNGLTETEIKLMEYARNDLKAALSATNKFYEEEWTEYKNRIDQLKLTPFKEVKKIVLE